MKSVMEKATEQGMGMDMNEQVVMTSAEVATFLKVSLGAVRRWARSGKLKGHRLGGRGDWRYLRRDVLAFLYGTD